tara:strand:- start:1622 stop:1987 length:366 start_codon:yes stop_codon:yes gene_type:complete
MVGKSRAKQVSDKIGIFPIGYFEGDPRQTIRSLDEFISNLPEYTDFRLVAEVDWVPYSDDREPYFQMTANRMETTEETKTRLARNRKRSTAAKNASKTKLENKKEAELAEYKRLKAIYDNR